MKIYKDVEWTFIFGECGFFDPNENIYVDLNNKPITGILENFYFFKENDPKNNVYVENGKRI